MRRYHLSTPGLGPRPMLQIVPSTEARVKPEFFLIQLRKLTPLTLLISIADTVQTRNCLRNSCDHIDQRRCWDYPLPYLQTRHTAL